MTYRDSVTSLLLKYCYPFAADTLFNNYSADKSLATLQPLSNIAQNAECQKISAQNIPFVAICFSDVCRGGKKV